MERDEIEVGFRSDGVMRRVWLILAALFAVVVPAACGGSEAAPRSGSGGSAPAMSGAPAVIDTTLVNNYEVPDVVQASVGSWTNCSGGSSCTYTYRFQGCTGVSGTAGIGCSNIGSTPQCLATTAITCNYTLTTGDVGELHREFGHCGESALGTSRLWSAQAVGPVVRLA